MAKLKNALFGLSASGSISKVISYVRRQRQQIVEKKPELKDTKTGAQLSWRHMFLKVVALWHALSAAEKEEWESAARPKHMTGYAWFISQALRPNPGIYLPLQGGTMQGIIDMDGYAMQDLLDPVGVQDADTKAARDAAIAAAIGGSLTCDIYGYDGANWQKLLVESAAHHNLRTRLYEGATPISSYLFDGSRLGAANRGLIILSMVYGSYRYPLTQGITNTDGVSTSGTQRTLYTLASLMGFNGASYDRLRTYGTGILKVGRAEIDSTTVRKVAAGAVIGGARKLFWVSCSPGSPGAEFELTDAVGGGQPVIFDHFDPDKHSEVINFDPPLKFATGIWIEKFDHIHSLVFCYI